MRRLVAVLGGAAALVACGDNRVHANAMSMHGCGAATDPRDCIAGAKPAFSFAEPAP